MMNLLELKKYAIDHRVQIKFSDPHTFRECVISERGLVKIPGEDKDFRVEDILAQAQKFEVLDQGVARHFTREAIIKAVAQSFERSGHGVADEEDE